MPHATANPHFLMCPPTFFEVPYAINPWMNPEHPVDATLAQAQWQHLKSTLEAIGANVSLVPAVAGWPDLIFTANAALIHPNSPTGQPKALLARFKHAERQGEEPLYQQALAALGYEVLTLPPHVAQEGAGEALVYHPPQGPALLLAAHGLRSDWESHRLIGDFMGLPVVSLALVDERFYHLDVACCPTERGDLLIYPPAFSPESLARLAQQVPVARWIEVSEAEACQFACNAVSVNQHLILSSQHVPRLAALLEQRGYTVHLCPMSETMKAGGAAKCCTLRLS